MEKKIMLMQRDPRDDEDIYVTLWSVKIEMKQQKKH